MSLYTQAALRDFFEIHGFYVRPLNVAYGSPGKRRKTAMPGEIPFEVTNAKYVVGPKPGFQYFTSDLPHLSRALVSVCAWHQSPRFTNKILHHNTEALKFIERDVVRSAEEIYAPEFLETLQELPGASHSDGQPGSLPRLMVIPSLPNSSDMRARAIDFLRGAGLDGVLTYSTLLLELSARVEIGREYPPHSFLHVLQMLKAYDLVSEQKTFAF